MALEIHSQKTGVGVYTEKQFVRIYTDHRIINKWGVGAYTDLGAYSGEYGIISMCTHMYSSLRS